jgi:hypothetical protein
MNDVILTIHGFLRQYWMYANYNRVSIITQQKLHIFFSTGMTNLETIPFFIIALYVVSLLTLAAFITVLFFIRSPG